MFAGNLVVRDDHRRPRFTSDADRFLHSIDHIVRFIANVAAIAAAVFGDDFAQLYELLRGGIYTRRVDQARGQTNGPALHSLPHMLFHLVQFLRGSMSVFKSHNGNTHGAVTDVGG
ncbi:MAG: hypothetical protein DDT34_02453 [Firmicutes bacterium]|nr:hypothetical protein [Bacillota bacterium]